MTFSSAGLQLPVINFTFKSSNNVHFNGCHRPVSSKAVITIWWLSGATITVWCYVMWLIIHHHTVRVGKNLRGKDKVHYFLMTYWCARIFIFLFGLMESPACLSVFPTNRSVDFREIWYPGTVIQDDLDTVIFNLIFSTIFLFLLCSMSTKLFIAVNSVKLS
jgi:hypothetical protein